MSILLCLNNSPAKLFIQIQDLEREIQEKQGQMRALEQLIIESGEASIANASLVEMQQVYNLHIPSLREHDFGPFQLRDYVLFLFSESNEFNDPVQ